MDNCNKCGKIHNHFYSPFGIGIKQVYYNCYWCGVKLKNNRKNRREHGLKCHKHPYYITIQNICHCENICVSCLKISTPYTHYNKCGCTYCNQCYTGYSIYGVYMVDFCGLCSRLGHNLYVKDCIRYYKLKSYYREKKS